MHKIYIVTTDPREEHNILVVTHNGELAYVTALNYMKKNNIGEGNFWKDENAFLEDYKKFDNMYEFVDHFISAWIVSPSIFLEEVK